MARSHRGAWPLPRILRLILLLLLATGFAWLSLSDNLSRAYPRQFGALRGAEQIFEDAGRELLANRGRLEEATYQRIADAAKDEPLVGAPYLFWGLRALGGRDLPSAERLLTEARTRDPRNLMSRLALMALYLRTGRVREGSDEIAVLVRILPRASQILVPELARLAASPESRQAVLDAVGDKPIMANVLSRLVEQNADTDLIVDLARRQPRPDGDEFPSWQNNLLGRLVQGGEVSRAYGLWRDFVGTDRSGLIYDPEFEGLRGPPPFNWALTVGDIGAAERARGGGLEIEYFGRRAGPLARQLLLLRPTRYRIELEVEGSASGQGARIALKVECRAGGDPLLNLRLEGLEFSPKVMASEFAVPAGCDAQWLTFAGEAAEFPNTQRARIRRLSLRPIGG